MRRCHELVRNGVKIENYGLKIEPLLISILGTDLQFFTFTFTTFNYYSKKTPPQYGY